MMRMEDISPSIKLEGILRYLSGGISLNRISTEYGVSRSTFQKWLANYELFGEEGLCHREKNQRYTAEMKRSAVEDYLYGGMSEAEVCKKYQLRSRSQLEVWIQVYNSHKEFQGPGGRRMNSVVTGRQRESREKRVEIVTYCLEHEGNYQKTADMYGVTYQQVYSWVNRYRKAGGESLLDCRKRHGCENTQLQRYSDANRRLLNRVQELEMARETEIRIRQYSKDISFSGVRQEAAYMAVKALHEEKKWAIYKLCAAAGICRAAYYKWLHREPSRKQTDDEKLAAMIREVYESQRGVPGYRQMTIILRRRYGLQCNPKRVYRIMKLLGLHSVCRRKKRRKPRKTPAEYTAENVLNRDFSASVQNEKWLTDITELKYGGGKKAYLSAILDLYAKNIVAFSLGRKNDTALVFDTFQKALALYPEAKPLLHSDRGCQYTSKAFQAKMENAGIVRSMSRPGKCIDNGPMESFWGFLKTEMYYLLEFDDYDALENAVADYMVFFNNGRYQKNLGCMTPAEFIMAHST